MMRGRGGRGRSNGGRGSDEQDGLDVSYLAQRHGTTMMFLRPGPGVCLLCGGGWSWQALDCYCLSAAWLQGFWTGKERSTAPAVPRIGVLGELLPIYTNEEPAI